MPVALASRNPEIQTVTLVLDTTTASAVIFAIAAHAEEREAHVRELHRYGQTLPEGSYGRRNRQAIAARETRVADRLRAVEHAYRIANERDVELKPPEPTRAPASPEPTADREIELELKHPAGPSPNMCRSPRPADPPMLSTGGAAIPSHMQPPGRLAGYSGPASSCRPPESREGWVSPPSVERSS